MRCSCGLVRLGGSPSKSKSEQQKLVKPPPLVAAVRRAQHSRDQWNEGETTKQTKIAKQTRLSLSFRLFRYFRLFCSLSFSFCWGKNDLGHSLGTLRGRCGLRPAAVE